MEPVRSPRNPRVVEAIRLHRARERRAEGLTLIEGPHLLAEAVEAGADIVRVFALADDGDAASAAQRANAELVVVDRPVLDRLAPTESPRGPVAVMAVPASKVSSRDAVVMSVADPGNAGTIIRTAAAFGFDVAVTPGSVDVWSPKVLRAGAGAHFRTSIIDDAPVRSIATVVEGGRDPAALGALLDASRAWSIVVGSESHGVTPEQLATAEVEVTIPMPGGTESLNAAVAAAIVMYEVARWRGSLALGAGPPR